MPDTREQGWLFLHAEGDEVGRTEDYQSSLLADDEDHPRHPDAEESGSTLIFVDQMPEIEKLLEQNKVAYSVLERTTTVSLGRLERRVWVLLVLAALIWGVVTGLSLAVDDFFLHPAAALFGWLALVVLAATTWSAAKHSQ